MALQAAAKKMKRTTTSPEVRQVVSRPLTDSDVTLISSFYRGHQKGLRVLGIAALALFILNTVVLWDVLMDETITFVLYFMMFFFGVAAIASSLHTLLVRRRISEAVREGAGIEVHATAHQARIARNVATWNIGPVSVRSTQETMPLLQEGAQVRIFGIPQMKTVLSINDIGLKYGARMTCPQNIDTLAAPAPVTKHASTKKDLATVEKAVDKALRSDERLTTLKHLRDKGLITEKDYEDKKEQILVEM